MKDLFSMKWFKEQGNQMANLVVEEQLLKNEILRKRLEESSIKKDKPTYDKLYKSLRLVNNVLTVVFNDGSIVSKSEATAEDFGNIKNAASEEEILQVIGSHEANDEREKEKANTERREKVYEGVRMLESLDDFEFKDGSVYLKGISRSLPSLLVEKFAEIANNYDEEDYLEDDEEYISLKRFFMWCCLNPRAEVADKLYNFLAKNGMKITKQGFFVALRNVVEVKGGEDNEIVQFISNTYNKVKGVWKKNPADFNVKEYQGEYSITKVGESSILSGIVIGNLKELYINLPDMKENRFTDNYTHSFDIRIGKVVKMPMEKCNWSTDDCAQAGLHFAGHTAPYVLCGDTTVFVLINPMTVVGIGEEKGRCYEYLPFMTTTVDEASDIMDSEDFDFLQLDESYAIHELESLEDKVKSGFVAETTKHQFNLPSISTQEIGDIINSLNEMKKEISQRIVNIS